MPLSGDDIRLLQQTMGELTRVVREQVQNSRQVAANGRQSTQTPTSGGSGGFGGSKDPSPLMGFGTSMARSLAQNTGPIGQAIGSIAQGAQTGGAFGAAAAAGRAIIEMSAETGRANQQGRLSAPLFSGRGREQFEGQFASRSTELGWERALNAPFEGLGFEGPATKLRRALGFKTADPTQQQRELDEDRGRRTFVADQTGRDLDSVFGNFVAAGGQVSDERLQSAGRVLALFNQRRQNFHERAVKQGNMLAGFEVDPRVEGR